MPVTQQRRDGETMLRTREPFQRPRVRKSSGRRQRAKPRREIALRKQSHRRDERQRDQASPQKQRGDLGEQRERGDDRRQNVVPSDITDSHEQAVPNLGPNPHGLPQAKDAPRRPNHGQAHAAQVQITQVKKAAEKRNQKGHHGNTQINTPAGLDEIGHLPARFLVQRNGGIAAAFALGQRNAAREGRAHPQVQRDGQRRGLRDQHPDTEFLRGQMPEQDRQKQQSQ